MSAEELHDTAASSNDGSQPPLPPVEPPSAGFLVQLFLVPGVIVAIIVSVWLAFHWLAHLGSDPQAYLRTLRRGGEGRWQAALNFANDLRGPGGEALKSDPALATALGEVLEEEIARGRSGEQAQQLKLFLCRGLGEFAVPEALPPLVERAADTDDPETARAAVEAIAALTANMLAAGRQAAEAAEAAEAVQQASASDDARLRSSAAFALGIIGGEEAVERLLFMRDDADENVRFNTATALARLGREEAYDPLAEMLSLEDLPAGPDEQSQSRRYKRALTVVNALRAVALVVDATATEPPGRITSRIEALRQDPVADVRTAATVVADKITRLDG
jgi:hypothetical protein